MQQIKSDKRHLIISKAECSKKDIKKCGLFWITALEKNDLIFYFLVNIYGIIVGLISRG